MIDEGTENDERVVMIPMRCKLCSILLQCIHIKRNVLLSSSLCMLARCFKVVFASINAIYFAVVAIFLTVAYIRVHIWMLQTL